MYDWFHSIWGTGKNLLESLSYLVTTGGIVALYVTFKSYSSQKAKESNESHEHKILYSLEVLRAFSDEVIPGINEMGQNWQNVFLDSKEKIENLSKCTPYGWGAPLVFIICYDKNVSWKRKYDLKDEGIVDASIVTTHMMFEAYSLGLGSTWVGAFDPMKVREVYDIPKNYEIVSILPVGYPSEESRPSAMHNKRNEIDSFTFYNEIK